MTRDAWRGIADAAAVMFFVLVAGVFHDNLWLLVVWLLFAVGWACVTVRQFRLTRRAARYRHDDGD